MRPTIMLLGCVAAAGGLMTSCSSESTTPSTPEPVTVAGLPVCDSARAGTTTHAAADNGIYLCNGGA
jgi:hypothetical protein